LREELKLRLLKHITFLEQEMKDYAKFERLSGKEYREVADKRRNVERWVENIINSSIDISKVMLTLEGIRLPDTYKDIVKHLSLIGNFGEGDMERLSRWVSLRNIISHEYLDIRWTSIQKFVAETRSLYEDFLNKVKGYLERKMKEDKE